MSGNCEHQLQLHQLQQAKQLPPETFKALPGPGRLHSLGVQQLPCRTFRPAAIASWMLASMYRSEAPL